MKDIVVTTVEIDGLKLRAAALYEDMQLIMLQLLREKGAHLAPGTIFIGKAENQQKNIGSTFIRRNDALYYLSGKAVRPGEELPVQVVKSASGKKRDSVDTALSIAGRYAILSVPPEGKRPSVRYSSRFTAAQKETVSGWIPDFNTEGLSLLFRTNAAHAEKKDVQEEVNGLAETLRTILRVADTRTCFSILYEPLPAGPDLLADIRGEMPERMRTDDPSLYASWIRAYDEAPYRFGGMKKEALCLYDDASMPLRAIYNMNRDIGRLLTEKVFLKSGAYLMIQRTEAFTVIDVNSGKFASGKVPEETYRKVNREACAEAARQMVLRNLSGIILIDFINMKDPDHREELLNVMRKELKKDPLRAEAVDITKLGIMEITRKRRGKSIPELFSTSERERGS